MNEKTERELHSEQVASAEAVIKDLISNSPQIMFDSPFLGVRTGLIAKLLFMNEIYQEIQPLPGALVEVGAWYGQTSIIFENLRAIYEPFNLTREIVSIDSFEGYSESSGLEISQSEIEKYDAGSEWIEQLESIQSAHAKINRRSASGQFSNVKGDVLSPKFWDAKDLPDHIAMCYFDIATYETTISTLEGVLPKLAKGGVFVFDDFGPAYPGVSKAISDLKIHQSYKLCHSKFYPSKVYFVRA